MARNAHKAQRCVIGSPDGPSLQEFLEQPPEPPHETAARKEWNKKSLGGPWMLYWFRAWYSRILAASTGLVVQTAEPLDPLTRERFDRANVPVLQPGADVVAAAEAAWPLLRMLAEVGIGLGSPIPQLVCVGDCAPSDSQRAFESLYTGGHLGMSLRALGWDELALYLVNARGLGGPGIRFRVKVDYVTELRALHRAFSGLPSPPTWIAFGANATRPLQSAGVPHLAVTHPQRHRRLGSDGRGKGAANPSDYAALLLQEGVPQGPWRGRTLATFLLERGVQPRMPDRYHCDGSIPKLVHSELPKSTTTLGPERVRIAHDAYVTGSGRDKDGNLVTVGTLRDAERVAGFGDHGNLHAAINLEEWNAEREEYHRGVSQRAIEKAGREDGKRLASCRGEAWDILETALKRYRRDLDGGETKVTARDALALTHIAVQLNDVGDPMADAIKEELRALTYAEVFKKGLTVGLEIFGQMAPPEPTTIEGAVIAPVEAPAEAEVAVPKNGELFDG